MRPPITATAMWRADLYHRAPNETWYEVAKTFGERHGMSLAALVCGGLVIAKYTVQAPQVEPCRPII